MNRIDGGVGVAGTSQGDGIVGRGGAGKGKLSIALTQKHLSHEILTHGLHDGSIFQQGRKMFQNPFIVVLIKAALGQHEPRARAVRLRSIRLGCDHLTIGRFSLRKVSLVEVVIPYPIGGQQRIGMVWKGL